MKIMIIKIIKNKKQKQFIIIMINKIINWKFKINYKKKIIYQMNLMLFKLIKMNKEFY